MFRELTNESLIQVFLSAKKQMLYEPFINALLEEILKRDIHHLLTDSTTWRS